MTKSFFYSALLLSGFALPTDSLIADEQFTEEVVFPAAFPTPWFTGPLVAPSGFTVKQGHVNIQPYLYFFVYNGQYSNHWRFQTLPTFYGTTLQIQTKVGIVNGLDFQMNPQVYYNSTKDQNYVGIGDLPLAFNIQLLTTTLDDLWPAIKLGLRVNAPIGKYEHLNPQRLGTDAIGAGSWLPSVLLVLAKMWHIYGLHYLEMRLATTFQVGTAVHVKGKNTYGGSSNTSGKAFPGNALSIDAALQYNLSQRWALACDFYYSHSNKNCFAGFAGTDSSGKPAKMIKPSNEQFSIAPAIEYNWSKNLGIIGGAWVTIGGRNASQYASGILSLNLYI